MMNSLLSTNFVLSPNSSKKVKSIDDQLIPLINIVFLLLIFFLVSGQIEQQSTHEVAPPTINKKAESKRLDKHLLVAADGKVFIGNSEVKVDQLGELVQQRFSEANEVFIKADRDVTAKKLSKLIKALKANSSPKIRFVATEEGR